MNRIVKYPVLAGLVGLVILTVGGCEIFAPSKVQLPPKMAAKLQLPPDDPAHPEKGVSVTREALPLHQADFADAIKAEAAEIAAKAKEDADRKAAELAAEEARQTRLLNRLKTSQSRSLAVFVEEQADQLDEATQNAGDHLRAIVETADTLRRNHERAAAELDKLGAAMRGQLNAAIAAADKRDENRLAVWGTLEKTVNAVAPGLGPWGLLATTGVGVLGGWLGLRKPGTVPGAVVTAANDRADENAEGIRALLDAADRAGVLGAVGSFLHKSGDPRDVAIVNELAIKDGLKL